MATARYETAAAIVKDAAVEEGLAELADPFSSTDADQVRLCRLLTSAGRELVRLYDWPHLVKTHTITVATADGRSYALPADFAGIVTGTAYNRTTDTPLYGPVDPDLWAHEVACGNTHDGWFRIYGGALVLVSTSDATDADVLAYEYRSKSWVMPSGGTVPTEDRATAATDTVYFDPFLIKTALRRAWRTAMGFDTTVIESQFWRALETAKSAETAARRLSLTPFDGFAAPSVPERGWTL